MWNFKILKDPMSESPLINNDKCDKWSFGQEQIINNWSLETDV